MVRKIGEIFSDNLGNRYQVFRSMFSRPLKCQKCSFFDKGEGCIALPSITGLCTVVKSSGEKIELKFIKLVKRSELL